MRGRKPTPPTLRLIKSGRKPIGKRAETKITRIGPPDPPEFLMPEAVEEWNRLAGDLYAAGLLTSLDRGPFAAYCQSYARWRQTERLLAADELVVVTHHGNHVQNVLLGIARRAAADAVRYALEFGMTPSARSRVEPLPPEDPDDPASRYL